MLEFNDSKKWKYQSEKLNSSWNISVIPCKEEERTLPNSLFKYYALNSNSLDALENQYLYASDRWQLNDPFDCHKELIDFNAYTEQEKKRQLSSEKGIELIAHLIKQDIDTNILTNDCITFSDKSRLEQEANNNSEKWQQLSSRYFNRWADVFKMEFFKKFGIVSMTESVDNMLMWAHYTNNIGYALEFDLSRFNKNTFLGPFQVAYRESFETCCYKKYLFTSFVFQSLIKSKEWEYEKEWRLLAYRTGEGGINITGLGQNILAERKFIAPLPISITLGCNFIDQIDLKYNEPHFEVTLSGSKLRIINHALHWNIPIYGIVPPELLNPNNLKEDYNKNLLRFKLTRKRIRLTRKVANTFFIEF